MQVRRHLTQHCVPLTEAHLQLEGAVGRAPDLLLPCMLLSAWKALSLIQEGAALSRPHRRDLDVSVITSEEVKKPQIPQSIQV